MSRNRRKITNERYINFSSKEALDYYNYLESLSLNEFTKIFIAEWESVTEYFQSLKKRK